MWCKGQKTPPGCDPNPKPRRDAVVACIVEHSPDVVATQEGIEWQLQDIDDRILDNSGAPKYARCGKGRGTTSCPDETSAIFYLKEHWDAEASGDFMHSSTPYVPGSKYCCASWPMITTWITLQGKGLRGGHRVLVLSTHLEPLNPRVRTKSIEQVLTEADRLRTEHDCKQAFLLGDFNCDCGSEPYHRCETAGWVDAVASVDGPYRPGSFTFHAFQGPAFDPKCMYFDRCIDFIWLWPKNPHGTGDGWDISAVIDKRRFGPAGPDDVNGTFPSDHYPVIADISLEVP